MEQPVNFSGVMPSAEAHFFDTAQMHVNNPLTKGSGINVPFPHPSGEPYNGEFGDYWAESGLLKTYGPDEGTNHAYESGIFHYNGLTGVFHVTGTVPVQADFNIFNPYVHYLPAIYRNKKVPFSIPYVSDYFISTPFYPYPF